jgi:hypothetical protein
VIIAYKAHNACDDTHYNVLRFAFEEFGLFEIKSNFGNDSSWILHFFWGFDFFYLFPFFFLPYFSFFVYIPFPVSLHPHQASKSSYLSKHG